MTAGAAPLSLRKAIFLDRDGVINRKLPENAYVRGPAEFEFLPGSIEALSVLRALGFLLIVTTNQRGIGRGLMTETDLHAVHEHMISELLKNHIHLDGVYHCPHDVYEQCGCRKPEPGMILKASAELCVDVARSYMVGDSPSDVAAGRRAGTRTVRIGDSADSDADMAFPSLLEFARFLEASVEERERCTG
jgi:D-glycero-D-manno-heptose 1,7-bisphosphate phosphatase